MRQRTFVYIIGEAAERNPIPVKVGVSSNPASRLSSLQTGNPKRLAIFAEFEFICRENAFTVERTILDDYKAARVAGEWLDVDATNMKWAIHDMLLGIVRQHGDVVRECDWQL